jgi:hypothetical protein
MKLHLTIHEDVYKYGFNGRNNTNSTFGNHKLPAPSLNISAYYIASNKFYRGTWNDPSSRDVFSNDSNARFLSNNVTYDLDYISKHGSCQPSGTYQWGFSSLLLFIFLLTFFIWSLGMYAFWIGAHISLRARRIHEIPGEYTATVKLAAAMQRDFDKEGEDLGSLSEHQITKKINRDLKGGRVTHDGPITPQHEHHFYAVLARWFWKEKWWLLLFAILTAIWNGARLVGTTTSLFFFILSLTTSIGVLAAMLIGRKAGSRVLIVLFFVIFASMGVFPPVSCIIGVNNS